VTDANLFLGYLGDRLGGEGLTLRRDLAEKALARIARLLKTSLEEAARGIRRVANAEMVKALRVISVERGHDPRRFVLVAFGGAGPMHGADLAAELGIGRVLLPDSCGVLSALGMVVGDQRRDWVRTVYTSGEWDDRFLRQAYARLEADAREAMGRASGTHFIRRADLRYRGQSHELTVKVAENIAREELKTAFVREHEKAYGYRAEGEPVELVNIRLTALTPLEQPELGATVAGGGIPSRRQVFFEGDWVEAQVWERTTLETTKVPGPAVIEEEEATTVVPAGWSARLDEVGNLWLEMES